jgi:uncharacterized protein YdhG (YjbR/CyaY superfamily)
MKAKTSVLKGTAKKKTSAKDVDAYLRGVQPESRVALERIRKTIKATAPKAEELISYQMPAFKHCGMLVFYAAFKNHCSLFVASKSLMSELSEDLKTFDTSGVTIRFTPDQPLPASLVRKIVKARVEENERRFRRKRIPNGKESSCRKATRSTGL